MSRKPPILIVHESDRGQTARRFVALLCFMEFYALFVCYGASIWNMNGNFWNGFGYVADYHEWTRIVLFAATALLYLCGRGLWRGGRRQTLWLWLGIIGLLAILLLEAVEATIANMDTLLSADEFGYAPQKLTLEALSHGMQAACYHLPVWLALIALLIVTKTERRWWRNDKALWVYCAAAYCLVWMVGAIFEQGIVGAAIGPAVQSASSVRGIQHAVAIVDAALLLATAVLLIRGARLARSTALLTAALNAVAVGYCWFPIARLVNIAVQALLNRVPFSTPVVRPYTWTKHDFMWLFVLPAHYVLPWLLIVGYAWRVPMGKPPDDGTPFPRRLCANCRYNLFGNETDRCPECGSALNATE